MASDPTAWSTTSPGDLSFSFPEVQAGNVSGAVERSRRAFRSWVELGLSGRRAALEACRGRLSTRSGELTHLIAVETGKPVREARMEIEGVLAKFDLTFADGEKHVREEAVGDGPHPAAIRHRPRGPAAVIAPFNFPIHLGHGAAVSYLLAGNPVIFKPSPFAVNVGLAYAEEMQSALPSGVFQLVPGWGETGWELCRHPAVRAVCFTGSIPVGTALARELAADYSKSLALELGGKNSVLVCGDADLECAAAAVADGMCLTAGQRCNATSRVLVEKCVAAPFLECLKNSLRCYVPGDPLDEATTLGPLISETARKRYQELTALNLGNWIMPGKIVDTVGGGKRGYYVSPAVILADAGIDGSPLARDETFAPILVVETCDDEAAAVLRHEAWSFGLTASIFTRDEERFRRIGDQLGVGNLYRNLPTTFSPSTLPFGGWRASGNGHPGGRGFIRFASDEQTLQWKP